jgi:hypothetical protein
MAELREMASKRSPDISSADDSDLH